MIAATERGLKEFSWWPDWRGECAAIVASGPSLKKMSIECLKDRIHCLAIKQTVERCPWAEIVYGCDAAWWISKQGLPKFTGIKIAHGQQATSQYKDLRRVTIKMVDEMLIETPMKIGNGGNSAFQALNLAIQFGAKDIVLVACDLHDRGGAHWYGRNTAAGMSNPAKSNFSRWQSGFNAVKASIAALGIDVVNVSPDSDLDAFRRQRLEELLEEWGL